MLFSKSLVWSLVLAAVAVGGLPGPASAQVDVTWNNGLDVSTPDRANVFQLGALLQVDGRFVLDDPLQGATNTLLLRRVRPLLQARISQYFEFRIVPDFGNGTTTLFDAYFDTKFSNALRVRAGKDKTPLGLEQLYSDYALLFPERSLVTDLVPNRDIGVQVQGDTAAGRVSYIAGVFNGVPDGNNGDLDTNGAKDVAGRVTVRPFARAPHPSVKGLSIAIGVTDGKQTGALPSFKTSAQQTFFTYASASTANGSRTRISPAASYYYRAFGGYGEYARTSQAVKSTRTAETLSNSAWELTGSFVVTGEDADARGVVPKHPFDPGRRQWGAVQVLARHSRLGVDPRAFTDGFAAVGASQTASATGVGVALYANPYVKYVLTFERTVFDAVASRPAERALIFRLQVSLQPSL